MGLEERMDEAKARYEYNMRVGNDREAVRALRDESRLTDEKGERDKRIAARAMSMDSMYRDAQSYTVNEFQGRYYVTLHFRGKGGSYSTKVIV